MTRPPLDYQAPSAPRRKVGPLVFGFVPLMVYPFCLLSNVMSLAGEPGRSTPGVLLRCASNGFLWGSTLYPVVWLVAAVTSRALRSAERPTAADRVSWVPLGYLLAVALCFGAWMMAAE
jgi:hypothetical protein